MPGVLVLEPWPEPLVVVMLALSAMPLVVSLVASLIMEMLLLWSLVALWVMMLSVVIFLRNS